MTLLEAATLGIIQGITEWLPVSSSGHLVLYQQFAKIEAPLIFDVLLHFASLVVIFVVFRKRIAGILYSLLRREVEEDNFKTGCNIIIGSIPIAVTGFLFRGFIESAFSSTKIVSQALVGTGILLFLTRYAREKRVKISPLNSVVIGISQAIALIPGISRSGMTISTGMILGIDRVKAAEFSFILALPAIFGATLFELSRVESIEKSLIIPLLAGMIISFVVGYFSLRFLLKLIQKGKLSWFSVYCITLGLIMFFE